MMPWVRFLKNYDFRPDAYKGHVTVAYKAQTVEMVTRECAEKAITAGAAVRTVNPEARDDSRKTVPESDVSEPGTE